MDLQIHKMLPQEMFVEVIKNLDLKSVNVARRVCKDWKYIIDAYPLTKACLKNSCKYIQENNNQCFTNAYLGTFTFLMYFYFS